MLVLYTGITRGASTILKQQSEELATNIDKKSAMKRMVSLCYQLLDEIRNDNLDLFGQILHEAWMLKRDMAPGVSTSDIDHWYETARKHGAIGARFALAPAVSSPSSLPRSGTRRSAIRCQGCALFRSTSSSRGSQIIFYQPTSSNQPGNGPGRAPQLAPAVEAELGGPTKIHRASHQDGA